LKTRMRGAWVASIVASSLAIAPAAYAQQAKPKPKAAASSDAAPVDKPLDKKQLADAKKHYGDGETKYKAGDYAGALVEFQAADAIKSTPQSSRYIGLCQDNLGHFPDAVASYQRFLANVPPKMTTQGDEIRARVAALQQLPGKLHVMSVPTGAAFAVDGKPQANPAPTDVEVPPGHHTLHFTAQGFDPLDKDVDVTYASKQDLSVTLAATPAPTPPAPVAVVPPPEPVPATPPAGETVAVAPVATHSTLPAWITGGLAVAAAGVGTAFGVLALNDKHNFDQTPTTATADSGENHALIADMAFGVAVTLGVTSAVLFLSGDDTPPPAATAGAKRPTVREASAKEHSGVTVTPTPLVLAHGGGAGALIRF
jgi:hypothetical protein